MIACCLRSKTPVQELPGGDCKGTREARQGRDKGEEVGRGGEECQVESPESGFQPNPAGLRNLNYLYIC